MVTESHTSQARTEWVKLVEDLELNPLKSASVSLTSLLHPVNMWILALPREWDCDYGQHAEAMTDETSKTPT